MASPDAAQTIPLLAESPTGGDSDDGEYIHGLQVEGSCGAAVGGKQHRQLVVLSGHVSSVSCLALCGEFVLSASRGDDIIVWQQPDLRRFAQFGRGEGSVKALAAVGNKVFTAHQDGKIRVWKVSTRSENAFRLLASLPTVRDYLGRCMKQSNYVETRRNHRKLWIEHADSISCLAVDGGIVYSGSWDRTLKVWRLSDLRCVESIRAHDDAINALAVHAGAVYTASADGKIKAWERRAAKGAHRLGGTTEGRPGTAWNAVVAVEEGGVIYGGASDGRVAGWKKSEGGGGIKLSLVCGVRAHGMAVLCLCAVGGGVLCSGSADRTIAVWRRAQGGGLSKMGVIRGHEAPVKCLQGSWKKKGIGGGFLLYSGGLDKSLRVWWVPAEEGYESHEGEDAAATKDRLEKKCVLAR